MRKVPMRETGRTLFASPVGGSFPTKAYLIIFTDISNEAKVIKLGGPMSIG